MVVKYFDKAGRNPDTFRFPAGLIDNKPLVQRRDQSRMIPENLETALRARKLHGIDNGVNQCPFRRQDIQLYF